MGRFRILPYKQGSKGAKALAEDLGGKVLKLQGSTFKPKSGDTIINWGNTQPTSEAFPNWYDSSGAKYLNYPQLIRNASNKLMFFQLVKGQNPEIIPQFWTDKDDIPSDAYPVVCRTVLSGHSGAGIVIANNSSELVSAPLYVKYVKKKEEYRVHLGRDSNSNGFKVIAIQRKARNTTVPDSEVNWKVRNHHNGFNFVRSGFVAPDSVVNVAQLALQNTGLDFGGVDVIWNEYQERAYVLEVNTAPGLEGQTVEDYATFFKELAL